MSLAGGMEKTRRRGQPLIMLTLLITVWVGGRAVLWESPFPLPDQIGELPRPAFAERATSAGHPTTHAGDDASPIRPYAGKAGRPSPDNQSVYGLASGTASLIWQEPVAPPVEEAIYAAGGHQLLWLAAMSHLPVPQAVQRRFAATSEEKQVQAENPRRLPQVERWSLDGWSLWREGSGSAIASQGRQPSYGASQAGAVLRYRLAPDDSRDPQAYARIYRALVSGGEREIAAGVSARPVQRFPLRAHAELRLTDFAGGTRLRPAGFVTTELPTMQLPAGIRMEAYGQAGYVGGEGSTAFADGQLHLLGTAGQFDLAQVSVGAGAWGGAQEGAERIDIGPSLRVDVRVGGAPARLSVDYRERVAGDAEPPSGMALTLSTRF